MIENESLFLFRFLIIFEVVFVCFDGFVILKTVFVQVETCFGGEVGSLAAIVDLCYMLAKHFYSCLSP